MTAGLMITIAGLLVAAASSLLGVWLERDPARPSRNGWLLSAMILSAAGVGVAQASVNRASNAEMAANMARILDDLAVLAKDDPALGAYVSEQVRMQAQANPEVLDRMSDRARARGEAPSDVLARTGLSAGDLSALGLPAPTVPVVEVAERLRAVAPGLTPVGIVQELAKEKLPAGVLDPARLVREGLPPDALTAEEVKALEDAQVRELKRLRGVKLPTDLRFPKGVPSPK
jgi:hypothetical protein